MPSLDFLDQLATPPATYRPLLFWVWNEQMTPDRIEETLSQYAERHVGGVFIHPRPGLVTEYLSETWFALWQQALETCQRLGMECHIYDENSYPSGFAGGHTLAANPHCIAKYATLGAYIGLEGTKPGRVLRAYSLKNGQPKPLGKSDRFPQDASPESPMVAIELRKSAPSNWLAGYGQVDLTNPATTRVFLETTHEAYRKRFSHAFGAAIKFAFADEPETYSDEGGLPLSDRLLREFHSDRGYRLEDRIDALFFDRESSPGVRHDYFATLNRLFIEGYCRPMHDWCEENGLSFTGHFMEHHWPLPHSHPSAMAALRWMQAPGNDLLAFQFNAEDRAANALYLFNLKEVSSIANQLERERVLTESTGGGGYDWNPRNFKPLEDYLLCFGVNAINPHLSHQSLAGARKYDWPHTIGDHAPWWDCYGEHAQHVGRANYALSQGREYNRVLLVQPTTTAWMRYVPTCSQRFSSDANQSLGSLKRNHLRLVQSLYESQIDFDLGDETVMEELATSENGVLGVGRRNYQALVLPIGAETLTSATVDLLEAYLAQDGPCWLPPEPPTLENGRPSDRLARLWNSPSKNCRHYRDAKDLADQLRAFVAPRISSPTGDPLPAGLCWRRAQIDEHAVVYYFCNPWHHKLDTDIRLEKSCAHILDTSTGSVRKHSLQQNGCLHLDLEPRGHALVLATDEPIAEAGSPSQAPAFSQPIELKLESVEPLAPNALMLDYCSYHSRLLEIQNANTIHVDSRQWQNVGYEQNPWNRSIQYRRVFIDDPGPDDSSFQVGYAFHLDPEALDRFGESLAIAVERPWLYHVECNGVAIGPKAFERWFDPSMAKASIGHAVAAGANQLVLRAEKFHPLAEIMPAYLLGDFALQASNEGFSATSPAQLKIGDWTRQGRPFYPGDVAYRFAFELEQTSALRIEIPDWMGSRLQVLVDSDPQGFVLHPPYELTTTDAFSPGARQLEIRVAGNLKNLMGPHFDDGLPGAWTWSKCPESQPPGDRYRFYPTGLMAPPVVTACQA